MPLGTPWVLGGVLAGVFLLLVAVMLWQEAKARARPADPVWGIEDASDFVVGRLAETPRSRLGRDGVRRIIEWQVYFLQMLARRDRDVPIVVGTTDGTVEYILGEVERQGHPMASEDVQAVLELVGEYLVEIGVVGPQATDDPLG